MTIASFSLTVDPLNSTAIWDPSVLIVIFRREAIPVFSPHSFLYYDHKIEVAIAKNASNKISQELEIVAPLSGNWFIQVFWKNLSTDYVNKSGNFSERVKQNMVHVGQCTRFCLQSKYFLCPQGFIGPQCRYQLQVMRNIGSHSVTKPSLPLLVLPRY